VEGDALQAGADRFRGFAGLYDSVRPVPPRELAALLVDYCGGRPRLVVDLGAGTGLSTRWAATWSDEAVGVEPNDDMRAAAHQRQPSTKVSYVAGWSHDTGLPAGSADVVLAVQALHWMEPEATLREVARILRPGGVFAAIDCDWPPVVGDHVAEQAWETCRRHIRVYEARLAAGLAGDALRAPVRDEDREAARYAGIDPHIDRRLHDGVRSWSKSGHLDRMSRSGLFAWCREVAMTSLAEGDADRFVGLLKSQGDYQALRRHHLQDAELGVDRFEATARARLGPAPRPWHFVYRARLSFAPR
jgi:SAM-dependent methyltransferase